LMAALIGANLVMLADLAGRTLFLPLDLPAGIFVAVLGTPFFLYLLINQRH
ncbi:iron chelate uptake ABC transporter family permease subunit, partial [Pseudomonas syringae]